MSSPAEKTPLERVVPPHATQARDALERREVTEETVLVRSAAPPSLVRFLDPLAMLRHLGTHWDLIWRFALRDVQGRYKGSYLGIVWSFVTPLLMLAVYTFVFGVVLGTRWEGFPGGTVGFSIPLFAGLIVFGVLSECFQKAPTLIVGNPNYVKKVVFPLEVLPIAALVASLVHAGISTAILLAGEILFLGKVSATLAYFPFVVAVIVMLTAGGSWFLASLGVFIRDIGPTVSIALTVLMFMSAVFYPPSALPASVRWVTDANPIALIVDDARRTLVFGEPLHWLRLSLVAIASAVVLQLGYAWFMRSKRWFADVV